jgi:hypothetical protein
MDTTPYALNRDYLFNGTLYEASDTKQPVPTALVERDKQLDGDKEQENAPSRFDVSDGLPEAIPQTSRDLLKEAEIDTWKKLKAVEDFEEVNQIGPSRAEDIEQAVDQVSRFHESEE